MQTALIVLLFVLALGYLGYRAYRNFSKKNAGCGKGCGCATDATRVMSTVPEKTTKLVG